MDTFIVAIDQGTTSSRAIVFDHDGLPQAIAQREHKQLMPQAGYVEHDATEILTNVLATVEEAIQKAGLSGRDIAAVGITNQRETTVVWDRTTGVPVYNAIVWQDTRTAARILEHAGDAGADRFRSITGLPLSSYFSASKIEWILDNVDGARERAVSGELAFGTIDTWLLWNLTGGAATGRHLTDVTNASRTFLFDIHTLDWNDDLLAEFGVPRPILPEVASSSEKYGTIDCGCVLDGVSIAGILGDQQAATFGQAAFLPGEAKNTYGTGNFLIVNTGTNPVHSPNGLLTTIAFQLGSDPVHYALEGSVAVTGSLIQWLRDNLGIIDNAQSSEELAASVPDNGGVYFVPAFSGLFAPHWRPDARGAIVGLTRFVTKAHITRASLEAIAFQTQDVLDSAAREGHKPIRVLKVDGGGSLNSLLMQFQADISGITVVRPRVSETTALGAAYAAGLAVGYWNDLDELRSNWHEESRWEPSMPDSERERLVRNWNKAITKSLDWVDSDTDSTLDERTAPQRD